MFDQQRGDAVPTEPGSDAELTGDEMLARIEAALETMPRFTREVFLALRFDDLSYPEIAQATGRTERQIEREISRALFGLHRAVCGRPLRWWEWWLR